jgi:hypothetical protein
MMERAHGHAKWSKYTGAETLRPKCRFCARLRLEAVATPRSAVERDLHPRDRRDFLAEHHDLKRPGTERISRD